MANKYVMVATFNVRNLIQPGVNYYGRNRYSEAAYEAKLEWLAEQLYRMNADVVALQETFDEASVLDLVERHGTLADQRLSPTKARGARYRHVWHLPNSDATENMPLPGLALLSRRPIKEKVGVQDLTDRPIELEPDAGLSYRLTRLSRPLQAGRVDFGLGVDAWVFNAHLKSKRPTFGSSAVGDPTNYQFYERTKGNFRSLARRAGEALALRRELLPRLEGSAHPVVVLGDLNDEVGAVTTEMVAGEMPWRGWSRAVKDRYWDVELYSAVRSHLRRSENSSIHTHIFNGHYGTIDHILVSQEFYYRNPDRIGDVNYVQVFNDHLIDNSLFGAPSLGPVSDHGQVAARLSIDPDRLREPRRGEFELTRAEGGGFRFVLKAANGKVIAESQTYRTRSAAERGIDSIRANAREAGFDDRT